MKDFLSKEQNQLKQMLINSGVRLKSIKKIIEQVNHNELQSFYDLSLSDQEYLANELIDDSISKRDIALSFIKLEETFEFIRKNKDALTD